MTSASKILGASLLLALARSEPVQLDEAVLLPAEPGLPLIHASEVLKHNSADDCWVVIGGDVWDVTGFLDRHPGGAAMILAHAGHDATGPFSPAHPPHTLDTLPRSALKGRVDPSSAYQLMLSNSEGEASDEEREKRRADLPPVGKIINLDEMEEMAKRVLGPESKAYGFYASVAEDGHAFRNSRDAYQYVRLRPRVLRPVSVVSTSTTFLSNSPPSPLPIFIAPAARAATGHPDGERTLVQGAAATGLVQCVSSSASLSVQQILQERDRVAGEGGGKKPEAWFQLYVARDRVATAEKIKRPLHRPKWSGGATAILLTVDLACQGKRENDKTSLGLGQKTAWEIPFDADLSWKDISWVQSIAPGIPVLLKGVASPEDTLLAFEHGAAGVVLSNHGGRQLDAAPPPLETLVRIRQKHPELLAKGRKDFVVLIDGGVRRGNDVLKALCLGARGVGLGRSFLYAQTAYGAAGVERVAQIMEQELQTSMRLLGVKSLDELGPEMVGLLDGLVAKDI